MIGALLLIHHNERTKMSVSPSERVTWAVEFSVRKHGYLWAMIRAMEGQDYENWQTENIPESDAADPTYGFWIGFSNGIRDFVKRMEKSTLDELIAEEQAVAKARRHDNVDSMYQAQALEEMENVG